MSLSPEEEEKIQRMVSQLVNGLTQAMVSLNKCLLNSGALKPGQFSEALKNTFNASAAEWERIDYFILRHLAKEIDKAEINDRRP